MSQCDGLDGLEDGIILNPRKCHPDLSTLSCADASSNKSSCMISQKIETMYSIYANWTSSQSGKQLFTSYEPGSEDTVGFVTGEAFRKSTLLLPARSREES